MKVKKTWVFSIILLIGLSYCLIEVVLNLRDLSYREKYNIKISNKEITVIKEKLKIKTTIFSWENDLNMINEPSIIIFHHAAIKNITVRKIDELHKNKGWAGIGYHYFISKDGTIYQGRPELAEGAHTIGKNKESIGICVEGNLEEEEITLNQILSLEKLSIYLCLRYDIKDMLQHKDFSNTLCPGKRFPAQEVKESVIKGLKELEYK